MNSSRQVNGDNKSHTIMKEDFQHNDDEEFLMKELQELWRCQDERVEKIAGSSEARPRGLDLRQEGSWRRRNMFVYIALTVAALALSVYVSIAAVGQEDQIVHRFGYVLLVVSVCLAIASGRIAVELYRVAHSDRLGGITMKQSIRNRFSASQIVILGAVVMVLVISYTVMPLGDGYRMTTQTRAERAAQVGQITNLVSSVNC